ncbi:BTB/POZ domain-containing protein 6-like isoform X4 [Physella acuta]|uniref:BTB/POZ domain-containing protein 6-like isoform X4 n=1 Tax=Physella acuta TaxID=109671 RepID=UPI0027DB31CE|nr:BTB/POZ domain-containing protein 6-like isoform X4 [Physella acuta]
MTTSSGGCPAYPGLDDSAHLEKASHNSENSDDSGVVDYKDPKSVLEQNRIMLTGQMSCDILFICGEKKERIGAHKYVLMTRSVVLKQMIIGAEDKKEFVVADIPGDYFWEMLRHIYCEEQRLEVQSVVGILYAADQYDLPVLKKSCLDYLHACLDINNACYLLNETNHYGYPEEEKTILTFIRKNAEDVFQTVGMNLLSKNLLNMVLTLPGLDVEESLKQEVVDRWTKYHNSEAKEEINEETVLDSIQDCDYVYRDDAASHRYILNSLTTQKLFGEREDPLAMPAPEAQRTDEVDKMSTMSSLKSRSSVYTYSKIHCCNMWPDFEQVTRFLEVYKSDTNKNQVDAITFSVDHDLYFYGFGIYGPKNGGEGKFGIDIVFYRKRKDIVLETINIKGAGVILPVMFERPIKIDKNVPYTLEIYIRGPESHLGTSGQTTVHNGTMLFTFSNPPKVKQNRSSVRSGQIPRIYFMPRNK